MAKFTKNNKSKVLLNDNHDFDLGKVPPNAGDIENQILGAIMIDNQVINDLIPILDYSYFYRQKNGIVYQAMVSLESRREPVDINTLKEELYRMGKLDEIGGVEYLVDLTASTSSSANCEYYARIVFEKYILRNLIHESSKIIAGSIEPTANAFELLTESEKKILEISESLAKKRIVSVKDEVEKYFKILADQRGKKEHITGVPTDFTELDEKTSGFQKAELIIIAGRPSHGKTALALNIARNAAVNHSKKVGLFSIEMSVREIIMRMLASEARVDGKLLKSGRSSDKDWELVANRFHKLKTEIYIDDSSELSVLELRAKARRMYIDYGIDMVIVDYLQLVKGQDKPERRDLEVAYVSRSLKALAKELDIPVVACAQLNRGIEQSIRGKGSEKRPQLADLRESGAIEQDADVVIFVFRPNFGKKLDRTEEDYEKKKKEAHIIIAKQRNGPTHDFQLAFTEEYARFENMLHHPDISIPPDTPF